MASLAVLPFMAEAQNEAATQLYSRQDLGGSARFQSMAGAFGSLGGDYSSVRQNPAGIALMRSPAEISFTFSGGMNKDAASWVGNSSTTQSGMFNLDGFSYTNSSNRGSEVGFSFGFGVNRTGSFNREITQMGGNMPDKSYSVADYIAGIATLVDKNKPLAPDNLGKENAWDLGYTWFPILGYQSGLISPTDKNGGPYHTRFIYKDNGTLMPFGPQTATMKSYRERGNIHNMDFSFGFNMHERFFLGGAITYSSIKYSLSSKYNESFKEPDYLYMENQLTAEGGGLGVSLGMIVQPVQGFKLGLAYFSPTWYKMRDRYVGYAESHTPNLTPDGGFEVTDKNGKPIFFLKSETPEGITDYRFRSPGRWVAGASYIFGRSGLISFDYEYRQLGSNGIACPQGNYEEYADINTAVKEDFGAEHTYRVGLELKPSHRSAVRLGYLYRTNPIKNPALKADYTKPAELEIIVDRTLPHYTLFEGQQSFTGGLGYRFSPQFYMDMAVVYATQKSHTYAFPTLGVDKEKIFSLPPINVNNSRLTAALTIGYKF